MSVWSIGCRGTCLDADRIFAGAWGHGIFQSDHDQDIICELNHEAGLEKLEKALEKRIKENKLSPEEHELYVVKKLPPYYTLCQSPFTFQLKHRTDS